MQLHPNQVYHIYNRGNNRRQLFYDEENYSYFLEKISKHIVPHCDLLGYCLLPNHFHLFIHANEETILPAQRHLNPDSVQPISLAKMSRFSHGLQIMLCSFARAINKRHMRTGSLFTQNTRCKMTSSEAHNEDYSLLCLNYIHNNPVKAGLVKTPEEWPYSSFHEYMGLSKRPLCNIELGRQLFSLDINELFKCKGIEIPDHLKDKIF